jgi:hypothetical protein
LSRSGRNLSPLKPAIKFAIKSARGASAAKIALDAPLGGSRQRREVMRRLTLVVVEAAVVLTGHDPAGHQRHTDVGDVLVPVVVVALAGERTGLRVLAQDLEHGVAAGPVSVAVTVLVRTAVDEIVGSQGQPLVDVDVVDGADGALRQRVAVDVHERCRSVLPVALRRQAVADGLQAELRDVDAPPGLGVQVLVHDAALLGEEEIVVEVQDRDVVQLVLPLDGLGHVAVLDGRLVGRLHGGGTGGVQGQGDRREGENALAHVVSSSIALARACFPLIPHSPHGSWSFCWSESLNCLKCSLQQIDG